MTLTYPGVYIEELPSGVHTITGVATSIAAFVGWAPKGPIDRAVLVLSWSDFNRQFGGLDSNSFLGHAVNHFFANGGQQAYIVRLASSAVAASLTFPAILQVTASSPGSWANNYRIAIKNRTDASNPIDTSRFRLAVTLANPDGSETTLESFENLSMTKADPRFVESVINGNSDYITVTALATVAPPPGDTALPSPLLSATTSGDPGTVLLPNTANFTTALDVAGSTSGGVTLLNRVDLFNLLCVPGETDGTVLATLQTYCRTHRAFLIADTVQDDSLTSVQGTLGSITGDDAINSALYYPWIKAPNPLKQNAVDEFPPCGFVAGLYAKTDANRGVWKAPAGIEASMSGVVGTVSPVLTDDENGVLNPLAINCVRTFPVYGTVIWGARTLRGNDEVGSEWKYIPVRRMALFLEESLYRGSKWVVFEPNDEPLWAQIRLNFGAFMHDLFRQGAFQGKTPQDAYFVKCDSETTTQNDINRGVVNIVVGFAPLKPAEFVVIQLQQIAGQIQA